MSVPWGIPLMTASWHGQICTSVQQRFPASTHSLVLVDPSCAANRGVTYALSSFSSSVLSRTDTLLLRLHVVEVELFVVGLWNHIRLGVIVHGGVSLVNSPSTAPRRQSLLFVLLNHMTRFYLCFLLGKCFKAVTKDTTFTFILFLPLNSPPNHSINVSLIIKYHL